MPHVKRIPVFSSCQSLLPWNWSALPAALKWTSFWICGYPLFYNDTQVQGSDVGPVAYFRNGTGNPLVSYTELSCRWGLSRATVCRILKKLDGLGYISIMSFGRHGSVIYLQNYLSTMFEIF